MNDDGYEIVCTGCGEAVSSDAASCPHCNQRLIWDPTQPDPSVGFLAARLQVAEARRSASPPRGAVADDYALPTVYMSPPQARELRYAGFWIRLAANLIDALLLWVTFLLAFFLVGPWAGGLVWLGMVLYRPVMESRAGQGTVGKQALNLRVTDLAGRRVSFGRALGRDFAKIISALVLCIGFMMVGWNQRKRGLHDVMAGTLVTRASGS